MGQRQARPELHAMQGASEHLARMHDGAQRLLSLERQFQHQKKLRPDDVDTINRTARGLSDAYVEVGTHISGMNPRKADRWHREADPINHEGWEAVRRMRAQHGVPVWGMDHA